MPSATASWKAARIAGVPVGREIPTDVVPSAYDAERHAQDQVVPAAALKFVLGVILTGMGSDGVAGLVELRRAGGRIVEFPTTLEVRVLGLTYNVVGVRMRFGGEHAAHPGRSLGQTRTVTASRSAS